MKKPVQDFNFKHSAVGTAFNWNGTLKSVIIYCLYLPYCNEVIVGIGKEVKLKIQAQ